MLAMKKKKTAQETTGDKSVKTISGGKEKWEYEQSKART
jgi:hypothetical protein